MCICSSQEVGARDESMELHPYRVQCHGRSVFPVPKLSVVNNNYLFFRFSVLSWDCEWEVVFFSNPAGSGSSVSPTFCLCTERFIVPLSCLFCCTSSCSAKRSRWTLNTLPGNHLAKVHNIITDSLQHRSIFPIWESNHFSNQGHLFPWHFSSLHAQEVSSPFSGFT